MGEALNRWPPFSVTFRRVLVPLGVLAILVRTLIIRGGSAGVKVENGYKVGTHLFGCSQGILDSVWLDITLEHTVVYTIDIQSPLMREV